MHELPPCPSPHGLRGHNDMDSTATFHSLGLDDRIVKALDKVGFKEATDVQGQMIPEAILGKDLLVAAPTGTGKTLGYALPILQRLLSLDDLSKRDQVCALILVPTKELVWQVTRTLEQICRFCWGDVSFGGLYDAMDKDKATVQTQPQILVSTPARLSDILGESSDVLGNVLTLVIDEADLVLSFGYEQDVHHVLQLLPSVRQTILTSATVDDNVADLEKLVLEKPVTIDTRPKGEHKADADPVKHYFVQVGDTDLDRFLLLFALLKLKVVQGKTLFFVDNVEASFRLKLFLEAFSIPSAVLNADMPINSRNRIIAEFNRGLFEYLIATDTSIAQESQSEDVSQTARGLDFKFVVNVINFDFPPEVASYVHRVGRTARGGSLGTALSFVRPTENAMLDRVDETISTNASASVFKQLKMRSYDLDGFRYRVEDVLRGVTRIAVREARLKELRLEMITSEKLKAHFEENPHELELLKSEHVLRPRSIQKHLKSIPDYLLPASNAIPSTISQPTHNVYGYKKRSGYRKKMQKRKQASKKKDPLSRINSGSVPVAGRGHAGKIPLKKRRFKK